MMRHKALLLSIAILCLSAQARGVEAGVIAVPSMNVPNMDMPTPKITTPNMDMPTPKPKVEVEPNLTRTSGSNKSSDQIPATGAQTKAQDVSGKWSVRFEEIADMMLDLTLWSSDGGKIMGYGTIAEQGQKRSITASGSFTGQELTLSAKSATPKSDAQRYDEYDLLMLMSNNSLSGTYTFKYEGQLLAQGNATARRQ